jgi:cysteine-rich repeat protein
MLPDPVTSTNSFAQIKSPVCGNSVIEGAEECDDGNDNEADDCNNECKNPIIPFIAWVDGYDDTGFNTNESITQIAEGIASNLRRLDRDVTFFGSGNCPELNSKVVIFFSSKNTYCTLSVTDYVVNNPGIRLTVIGDSAGADGLRSIAYPFGIRCDDFETGVWKEVTIESILFPNGRIGSSSACEMTGGARVDQSLQGEIESSRCVAVFRDAVGSRGEENGWCAVWVVDLANGSQINFYTTWDMQNSASFNNPDNRGRELGERAVTPLDEVN